MSLLPSGVNKVSIWTHLYLWRSIWPFAITTTHFTCGLMSDLVICMPRKKSMVVHDTEYPYWDQVSLIYSNSSTNSLWLFYRIRRMLFKTLREEVQESEQAHEDPAKVIIKATRKRYNYAPALTLHTLSFLWILVDMLNHINQTFLMMNRIKSNIDRYESLCSCFWTPFFACLRLQYDFKPLKQFKVRSDL